MRTMKTIRKIKTMRPPTPPAIAPILDPFEVTVLFIALRGTSVCVDVDWSHLNQ